jgi:hypothetical protein
MSRRQAELIAIGEAGLKLVLLPTQYQQGGIRIQVAYVLFWWPKILELLEVATNGSVLRLPPITLPRVPPWNRIDVQAARRRLKKSMRSNPSGN